jgi:hypothetical protein
MMDFLLKDYVDDNEESILDFDLSSDGNLTTITGTAEEKQRAIVAAFTQRGTIPQLPDTGVQWVELLTGQIGYAEVNSQILQAIHESAGTFAYIPKYTSENNKLVVSISEVL